MVALLIGSLIDNDHVPVPRVSREGGRSVIWLHGEQDLALVASLRAAMTVEAAMTPAPVVVDLRGVTFIDSSAVRALADGARSHDGHAPALALRAPSECVQRMFRICGQFDLLAVAPATDSDECDNGR